MHAALEALEKLQAGNARFAREETRFHDISTSARRAELAAGQKPFAVIVGCSDSRVPTELIFDQTLGDLFVIRIAGNIVAPSQIGSVEFAVGQFGTPLVVVLGHSRCGAVAATLDHIARSGTHQPGNLRSIVERIRPSVEPLLATDLKDRPAELLEHAVRANVRVSVSQLRHGSEILENAVEDRKILIVGAEYSLETGRVDFFEGFPADRAS